MSDLNKVFLPHRPTVDRIAALTILEAAAGHSLEIAFVNQTKQFTNEELKQLTNDGVYLLGVGQGETYAELGFRSETSLMVNILGGAEDAAIEKLCEIMDRNNSTGFLRKQAYSINWIIRQAYRLGYDPVDVVRKTQDVVRAFLAALRAEKKEFAETPEIKSFLNVVGRQFGPFSVSRFVRDSAISGQSVAPASWFVTVHDETKKRQAVSAKRAETEKFEEFSIPTKRGSYRGAWVDTEDSYLSEELAQRKDVVVVRSEKGNVVIFSRTMRLESVGERLADEYDETGHPIWKYGDPRFNAVFNGTEGVESPPTKKAKEEIIGVVQTYATPKR